MSLASVIRSEEILLLPTYDRHKILFEKGRGVYLWDSRGNRYLDFLSGIGVNALGHAHPAIQATVKRQAGRLIHVSNLFFHEYQAELAKRLTKISGLDRAFFCNSGTEAWEGALKLARIYARTREYEWPQAEVAHPRSRQLISWTHFWFAGHDRPGQVPRSLCAADAGSRLRSVQRCRRSQTPIRRRRLCSLPGDDSG